MKHLTILVADDDPVIRALFEKRLAKEGYKVTVAADGLEAARLLDQKKYDIVITDLVMPGDIGGLELLSIAKGNNVDCEVIVVTAHSSVDTAVGAMKKGAIDYIEKPVNFDKLFIRLEKIAELKSLANNADDLREAMDVTELTAGQTIQNLEITCADLQLKMNQVKLILADVTLNEHERIEQAREIIGKPL